MLYPDNNKTLTVEVKKERNKFYAELWQDNKAVNRSDLFNTAAGASVAGYLLLNEQLQVRHSNYFFEAQSRTAI